jgi:hypothetical protein
MSRKTQVKRQTSAKPKSVKLTYVKTTNVKPTNVEPLMTVPFENGFHFYMDIGKYTGITATSLSEFALKLQGIPKESVLFHFHRKDFQNWIKYTIKDVALAQRINNTKLEQNAEDLRKELVAAIKASNSQAIPT